MSSSGLTLAIARYTAMTSALRAAHPSLVLWPETVITTDLNAPSLPARALGARFAALARELDATLYAGSLAQLDDGRLVNALYIYDPHAAALPRYAGARGFYGKEQLVPMAEYLPGPDWLRALPYAAEIGAYAPTHNAVETVDGATPLICWESLFGDIAHARLRDDPSLLLVATDDAWFGTTEFPYEHAMAASMRAVETGRWVLQAGATGISGIVAPDGTWTVRTELDGPAVVVGDVGAPAPGPYAALGPFPVAVALALIVALPLLASRRR
jgi:apolipoprotein N-acyltransferase